MVSVLTPAEVLIAARRLAGARPHLAAVAGIVHHENLWQLCRDELTGIDVRTDGWDIRGRPDRTARTSRLTLTRGSTSSPVIRRDCGPLRLSRVPSIFWLGGEVADLTWEALDDIAAEHAQVFRAAISLTAGT